MLAPKKLPVKYKPHVGQLRAATWLIEKSSVANGQGAALFLDPGLGKTSATLLAFKMLKDAGLVSTMLVVAPLRVAQATWPAELTKWADFIDLTYTVLHGTKKQELLQLDRDIYIINYEGLDWLTSQSWKNIDIICFDELTRMKSWSSKRTKAIRPFIPTFSRRWGLTGTPVPNGFIDLFSQVYMLDSGKRFGASIVRFKSTYFKQPSIYEPYKWELTTAGQLHVYEKLSTLAFRVEAADWITLPTEVHNTIALELPAKLRLQYEVLKRQLLVELSPDQVITAASAAILTNKLRQFLSGKVYTDDGVLHVHNIKLAVLEEFVSDLNGNPLLVGYQYRHEAAMFKTAFPQASFIESATSPQQLQKIIADWNAGKIPILFGHPQSMGHGLNLQEACNTVMFYSCDFNLENHLQFIKRVSRQGQKQSHVMVHYLTFTNTLDQHVLDVLHGKSSVQAALLDFLADNV